MTCKERILSNDYADGVVDFPLGSLINETSDACYIELDDRYSVAYQNRTYATDFLESVYQYRYIPHLYGLMEMTGADTTTSKSPTLRALLLSRVRSSLPARPAALPPLPPLILPSWWRAVTASSRGRHYS